MLFIILMLNLQTIILRANKNKRIDLDHEKKVFGSFGPATSRNMRVKGKKEYVATNTNNTNKKRKTMPFRY